MEDGSLGTEEFQKLKSSVVLQGPWKQSAVPRLPQPKSFCFPPQSFLPSFNAFFYPWVFWGFFLRRKHNCEAGLHSNPPSAQGKESVLRQNTDRHREKLLSRGRPSHSQGVVCQGGQEERGLRWVVVGGFWADAPLDSARCSTSH